MSGRRQGPPPVALVLRALGLGDLLTAVPALRALRRGLPAHEIVLLTPERFAPLVTAGRLADRVLDTSGLGWLPPGTLGADVAVNLHGRGPESHRLLLKAWPARLVAFASDGLANGPRWRGGEHEVARWCRLVADAGFSADAGELDLGLSPQPVPAAAVDATVVHPGAAFAARRWPVDRWAGVVRAELAAGGRVVITGSREERALGDELARRAGLPATAVLAGRTSVLELAAVVVAASRVVCGDTGIAHVATAVGTPSVVLFGPTTPSEWGPPARPWHRVLWKGERGDPHGDVPSRGLLAISTAEVIQALAELPRRDVPTVSVVSVES